MTEIYPGIYRQIVEVEHKGESPINFYIIHTPARSLLIDTGFTTKVCLDAIEAMLLELSISYDQLDVWITHNHRDHSGWALELAVRGAVIYMNPEEEGRKEDLIFRYMGDARNGHEVWRTVGIAPEKDAAMYQAFCSLSERFQAVDEAPLHFPFQPVHEGTRVDYGEYHFQAVLLRGHTHGQLGLYEKNKKILFCGDHMMTHIAPIVGAMYPDAGLLNSYVDSMRKMKHVYGDCTILSCHYDIITPEMIYDEVNRIIFSYLDKCELIKEIAERGRKPMTVCQIAKVAYARPDVPEKMYQFLQFVMIVSKTFACLEYLYEEGFISRMERDGILYWYI